MGRPAGSTNSTGCQYCGESVVRRMETPHSPIQIFDYDKAKGKFTTKHTCNPDQALLYSHSTQGYADGYTSPIRLDLEQIPETTPIQNLEEKEVQTEMEIKTTETPDIDIATGLNAMFSASLTPLKLEINQNIVEGLIKTLDEAKSFTTEYVKETGVNTDAVGEIVRNEIRNLVPTEHRITINTNDVERVIEARPHKKLQQITRAMARRHNIWICGPAGGGKTTVAKQASEVLGLPFKEISCGPATTQWDLFGFISPDGRYIEGHIRNVYENGGVLFLDEIDNANPSVLVALNNVIANGQATFPDGMVKKHKDFVCAVGANTFGRGADRQYVGRMQIDAATIDRFAFIVFDYDEDAELDWAGRDETQWVQYCQAVRHAAHERQLLVIVSPRASIMGAEALRCGEEWEEVMDMLIWDKMSPADREMLQAVVKHTDYKNLRGA